MAEDVVTFYAIKHATRPDCYWRVTPEGSHWDDGPWRVLNLTLFLPHQRDAFVLPDEGVWFEVVLGEIEHHATYHVLTFPKVRPHTTSPRGARRDRNARYRPKPGRVP